MPHFFPLYNIVVKSLSAAFLQFIKTIPNCLPVAVVSSANVISMLATFSSKSLIK